MKTCPIILLMLASSSCWAIDWDMFGASTTFRSIPPLAEERAGLAIVDSEPVVTMNGDRDGTPVRVTEYANGVRVSVPLELVQPSSAFAQSQRPAYYAAPMPTTSWVARPTVQAAPVMVVPQAVYSTRSGRRNSGVVYETQCIDGRCYRVRVR